MATKVHDVQAQYDDREFAEIDTILAQAKRELRRDRKHRRNLNLSDIPENFAHVPASCLPPSSDVVDPQLDSASSASPTSPPSPNPEYPTKPHHPLPSKLHILGLKAPMSKWLRAYMGCLIMANSATCDAQSTALPPRPPPPVAGYRHIIASETTPRV